MSGSLHLFLISSLFVSFQWRIIDTNINSYENDGGSIVNPNDHTCLFIAYDSSFEVSQGYHSFCFRPDTTENIDNNQDYPCFGEMILFKQLKSINVSVSALFKWNAAIKTIESYSKYLVMPTNDDDNISYCKCLSPVQFGDKCQYEFDIKPFDGIQTSFMTILNSVVTFRNNPSLNDTKIQYVTCFVGIPCQNSFSCLDWRQICDGIVDCDHGDDEIFQLCSQIELNECDPEKEYRCQNGMCIPIELGFDSEVDCSDWSDEKFYSFIFTKKIIYAFISDEFVLDEMNCAGRQYTCGTGQCISYTDAFANLNKQKQTCGNQRNIIQLRHLFSPRSNTTDSCWILMMCLTGFSDLYSNFVCSNQNFLLEIELHCPNEFFFPPNPVAYSFVYFLYEKRNRSDWTTYKGPNYICYNKSFCLNHSLMSSTVSKANLTCFIMNSTSFTWTNFYEYVLHLFNSCYSTFSNTQPIHNVDSRKIFRCNWSNTFISIHRVKNKMRDCYFGEDENETFNLCSIDPKEKVHCFTNQTECIRRRFIRDRIYDCTDGSDEHSFNVGDLYANRMSYEFHPESRTSYLYPFTSVCDHIVDQHFVSFPSNENDETDCEYWPYKCYNSPYTFCNGIWNCQNGIDELNCDPEVINNYIEKEFKCGKAEHYCIQFINNRTNIKTTCLTVNRTNDGVVDCIGATDERFSGICTKMYPFDYRKRFSCMNSSICISAEQVCDRIIDCPFEDDELVCPWLYNSNLTQFHCNNSLSEPRIRCQKESMHNRICLLRENLWFCDLSVNEKPSDRYFSENFDSYPIAYQSTQLKLIESDHSHGSSPSTSSILSRDINLIRACNLGHPIKSVIARKGFLCLCPMFYYGDYCQYQSERITIHLKVKHLYYLDNRKMFRLMIYLLNDNHEIISYEEIVHHHQSEGQQYIIVLLYRRLINVSLYERTRAKSVRIDSYMIQQSSVQYVSNWFYDVRFPFLPVNRLAIVINLEDELFLRSVKCQKKCGAHGRCMYYVNDRQNQYCRCDLGWFGEQCQRKLPSDLCHPASCAPHSQCIVLNHERKLIRCICPIGKSGNQCYIAHNPCVENRCQNNGTCLPLDQRSFTAICICPTSHSGPYCDFQKRTIKIFIDSHLSQSNRIPAANVIVGTPESVEIVQQRTLFTNIDVPTVLVAYGIRQYGLIHIFYNFSSNVYYMIAALHGRPLLLNTSVIEANRCQNISTIFNRTILRDYSYLKRLKLYHLPCRRNRKLRCFFDEYRMCFCNRDSSSNCFIFDHTRGHCDYCQNNGLCVQEGHAEKRRQYICICAPCTFGSLCQFSIGNYYINLDILVGKDIRTGLHSIGEQPATILVILIVLSFILFVSLISNVITFLILSEKHSQKVGCDVYLYAGVFISQIGILALFLRYLYMIFIQMYAIENVIFMKVGCVILEYLIRLTPALFDWLIACISMERTYMIVKDVHYTKTVASRVQKLARWVVLLIILLNVSSTIHRPFYLILVGEPALRGGDLRHPWCILRFDSSSWNIYEKFINIFHLTVPFFLNVVSIICFIFYRTKSEMVTSVRNRRNPLGLVIRQQLSKYKTILISNLIIVIVEMPRFVLTFAYGCAQEQWHQYAYLVGYLVSYLPLTAILLIYVLPSPKYRNQFWAMLKKNRFTHRFIKG